MLDKGFCMVRSRPLTAVPLTDPSFPGNGPEVSREDVDLLGVLYSASIELRGVTSG